MGVTTSVHGRSGVEFKGFKQRKERRRQLLSSLRNPSDVHELDRQDNEHFNGITHVSRLQCIQASVEAQISALAREKPWVCAGLVLFGSDVTIVGDGAQVLNVHPCNIWSTN